MKKVILLAAALMSTASFGASLQSLNKNQATQLFQGNTMTTVPLVTLNKQLVTNNPITIYFDKQGTATGKFENKPDNAPQNDEGKWMVKGNGIVCVTWQNWNETKPLCVYVYKTNNSVLFINADNNNFESMALKTNMKTGNGMGVTG